MKRTAFINKALLTGLNLKKSINRKNRDISRIMDNFFAAARRETRVSDYILPVRIIASEGGIDNPEAVFRLKTLQIGLTEPDVFTARGAGYIILDFGREIHGGVRFLTYTASPSATVRLRFGESVTETCAEISGGTATNDHSPRDFCVLITGLSDLKFGSTGFRFLRIDFPEGAELRFKGILAVFEHRDLQRKGAFRCDDAAVNEIFETSAYTVELCMQNMIWDGIKRDRLVWIGDMHPEVRAIQCLYGNDHSIVDSLRSVREVTPLPNFMNNMPAYSLWWLAIVCDYYLQNGDAAFIAGEMQYIEGLVSLFGGLLNDSGRISLPQDQLFLDWPTSEAPARAAGVQALFAYAMQKLTALYKSFGKDTAYIEGLLSKIKTDDPNGGYKQVAAMQLLVNPALKDKLLPALTKGGAKGLSTFMSFYILSAMSDGGNTAEPLKIMKEYYGGMLSRGATTFWEDFDIEWLKGSGRIDAFPENGQKDIHGDYGAYCYKGFRHSLCHGWSSGPVPYLLHEVAGVQILEPGCKKLRIKPAMGGLKHISAVYPTPHGDIKIELENNGGGAVRTKLDVPMGIEVEE